MRDTSGTIRKTKDKYHFGYRTAGFWHVTEIWCNEKNRKTPDEMAVIMTEVAGRMK